MPLSHPVYHEITYLQQRGYLKQLHPTALPYKNGELGEAIKALQNKAINFTSAEKAAIGRIENYVAHFLGNGEQGDQVKAGWRISAGVKAANTGRMDVLRPLNDGKVWPDGAVMGNIAYKNWIGQAHLTFDRYYDTDPDGLDVARRLYTRSEHSYLGYSSPFVDLYVGRLQNHWGNYGGSGVLLSSNPRAMDQVNLRIGTSKFSLRFVAAELDNLAPDGTFTADESRFGPGSVRRYLYLHRFDWRPNPHLLFSLMEGVLYSAENGGPSLTYANPFHFAGFVTDNNPKNYENNLLVGGSVWAYWNGWTLEGQLMLDDFTYEDRAFFKEQEDLEPISAALTGSVSYSKLHPAWIVGARMDLVTSQAYRTDQKEGQWSYAQRGLAFNHSDFAHLQLYAKWRMDKQVPGLQITPKLDYLEQGEGDFRLPLDTDSGPVIGVGTAEKTLRPGFELFYRSPYNIWVKLDWGISQVTNNGHVAGLDETQMIGMVHAGFSWGGVRNYGD